MMMTWWCLQCVLPPTVPPPTGDDDIDRWKRKENCWWHCWWWLFGIEKHHRTVPVSPSTTQEEELPMLVNDILFSSPGATFCPSSTWWRWCPTAVVVLLMGLPSIAWWRWWYNGYASWWVIPAVFAILPAFHYSAGKLLTGDIVDGEWLTSILLVVFYAYDGRKKGDRVLVFFFLLFVMMMMTWRDDCWWPLTLYINSTSLYDTIPLFGDGDGITCAGIPGLDDDTILTVTLLTWADDWQPVDMPTTTMMTWRVWWWWRVAIWPFKSFYLLMKVGILTVIRWWWWYYLVMFILALLACLATFGILFGEKLSWWRWYWRDGIDILLLRWLCNDGVIYKFSHVPNYLPFWQSHSWKATDPSWSHVPFWWWWWRCVVIIIPTMPVLLMVTGDDGRYPSPLTCDGGRYLLQKSY